MSARTHPRPHPVTPGRVEIRLPWWAVALPALAFATLLLLLLNPADAHAAAATPRSPTSSSASSRPCSTRPPEPPSRTVPHPSRTVPNGSCPVVKEPVNSLSHMACFVRSWDS
ncbi:hypothetical protein ACFQ51_10095 [Streptomyces kaempferi]